MTNEKPMSNEELEEQLQEDEQTYPRLLGTDPTFQDMAKSELQALGLTEDEADREIQDFLNL